MFTINLEYPTSSNNAPRYTAGKTSEHIDRALAQNHGAYRGRLTSFAKYFEKLGRIEARGDEHSPEPRYINDFLSGLDSVSLYCMLAEVNPRIYLEIGSGNSTKFARKSISDNHLSTRVISIDPYPRAEIDALCDEVIRLPLEDVDLGIFSGLHAGDVVFVDNSHRSFMNSDVTVCFIDIMPRLECGVYYHMHDIFWPVDYPAEWSERFYNEQYLLGALLANGLHGYEIVLPNSYVSLQRELAQIVDALWASHPKFDGVEKSGCSFWMKKK